MEHTTKVPHRARTARRAAVLLPLLAALGSAAAPAAAQNGQPRGLDAYIEKAIADWQVPGLGLAIVKDDSIVYAAGYGEKELGKPDPVDAETIFAIGSSSKAFTALLMALLVQEEKAEWDDPVTKHLPGFQLYDPYATREMTLRDLLTHRSGLTRGDRLWYGTELDRDEILQRVRFLEPSWSLRSRFGYQNIMYLAAGEVEEELTGKTWDQLVQERIFDPLGMRRSSTSTRQLAQLPNVATPHTEIDDAVVPIEWRNIDNIAAAGSINSSVVDMAQWVRLHLGRGTYRGQELVKPELVREMHQPQMLIALDTATERLIPSNHFRAYGLGWFLEDYRGRKLVHHGGNIDGMSALVAMMPEENVGLVILTNMNGSGLPGALMRHIFDRYLEGTPRDWSADMLARRNEQRQRGEAQQQRMLDARVSGTQPSLALERYAGIYEHPMYGELEVRHEAGKLLADAGPSFIGELEHWHYDTFRADWRDPAAGQAFLTFTLNARGEIAHVDVQGLGEFARRPDPAARAGSGP